MRRESGNGKYPFINFTCLILVCIFFILKGNPLQAQDKYTLTSAVDYAVNNNLNLKELRLNRALDDDILVQSKVNLLPNLNGTLSRFNSYGRSINPTHLSRVC